MHILLLFLLPLCLIILSYPVLVLAAHIVRYRGLLRDRREHRDRRRNTRQHACVLSLSPGNQSPRALNHALSLAMSGKFTACFHAYPPQPVRFQQNLDFIPVTRHAETFGRAAVFKKIAQQSLALYESLVTDYRVERYDVILVNTPPCIPVFIVTLLAARLFHSCPVVVDWHNFAYTIMQTTGARKSLVSVAHLYEMFLGRVMNGHLCVSRAMSRFLADHWGIDAYVVYDRPLSNFRKVENIEDRHRLLLELQRYAGRNLFLNKNETIATVLAEDGTVHSKSSRPALITSSTSWTPDENFDILLEALVSLDTVLTARRNSAVGTKNDNLFGWRAICVITGKGPLRSSFESKIASARLANIEVWFAWLPSKLYPGLLGCADLGLSLHTSSSQLDLPMKVVDMLGCGLPVLAYSYGCMGELIRPGITGYLFQNSTELSRLLLWLLFDANPPRTMHSLASSIQDIFASPSMRWESTWESQVLPVLENICK